MKLTSSIISLVALFSFALAGDQLVITYNSAYDDPNRPLDTVACNNYLTDLRKGYTTYDSLPTFPNIGGFAAITGPSSTECGTCWHIIYKERSIYVLGIGHVQDGVELPSKAMKALLNENEKGAQFPKFPLFTAYVMETDKAKCGM